MNSLVLIYLFIDYRIYLVTKTHLGIKQIVELVSVFDLVADSTRHTGQQLLTVILEVVSVCLLPLLAAIAGLANGSFRIKTRFLAISILLAVLHFSYFSFFCRNVSLLSFLPLRLELGNLPFPAHPAVAADRKLVSIIRQKINVRDSRLYPKLIFKKDKNFRSPNLVIIAAESLRRKEFDEYMPRTKKVAREGLWLSNHFSTSNISASSFHGIFRSSFPVNLSFRDESLNREIDFQNFLLANGYETVLLKASNYSAFPARMTWGKKSIELDIPDKARNPEILLNETLRLMRQPGKKAIFVYTFNTHFNYYYPEDFESHVPVLDENENLFLLTPDAKTVEKVRNRYINSVQWLDIQLGNFFRRAKEEGYFENTVFVLFGDHGESLGEAGFFAHATGPHKSQFETPAFIVGSGIESQICQKPTTHSDLLPILAEQLNVNTGNAWGRHLQNCSYPILQIDESVTGRLIVRHEDFMSIFDLDVRGNLTWLATVGNDYTINESLAGLYVQQNFTALADQIAADSSYIKSRLE
ncbi:MAG: hypothetical protein Kow0029_15200 [Candidatus Rifleibacteriota bacterium]